MRGLYARPAIWDDPEVDWSQFKLCVIRSTWDYQDDLPAFLRVLERIEAAGAGFRSLTESIDTTTPAGRMLMQMLGSFAEYERAMVKERTAAGLAAARAEGRVGGRRPKLTAQQRADIVENVRSGRRTAAQMARLYAVSQPTISRILASYRASRPDGAASV